MEAAFKIIGRDAPLTRPKVDFFLKHRAYDITKARRLLNFAPQVRLDEGLPRTIAWYRKQGWLKSI